MRRTIAVILVVLILLAGSLYGLYRHYFPMGMEHRCDKMLWLALREYAEKHNGAFPSGEATPEASISLIHSLDQYGYEYAYLLHRRDVPTDVVREVLQRGQLLDPDTCGWNYVEGLRRDSDWKLALFWDKEGLGHDGQRLSEGGHVVTFVDGRSEHIPGSDWEDFQAEQRRLLKEEMEKRQQRPREPQKSERRTTQR